MSTKVDRLKQQLEHTHDPKVRAAIDKMIADEEAEMQRRNARDRQAAKKLSDIEDQLRRTDAQRKIVAGAIFLEHMAHDEQFRAAGAELLRKFAEKRNWHHYPEVFTTEEIAEANHAVEAEADKRREVRRAAGKTGNPTGESP